MKPALYVRVHFFFYGWMNGRVHMEEGEGFMLLFFPSKKMDVTFHQMGVNYRSQAYPHSKINHPSLPLCSKEICILRSQYIALFSSMSFNYRHFLFFINDCGSAG